MKKVFKMTKVYIMVVFTISLSTLPFPAHAQLSTTDLDSGLTPDDLANTLLGGGDLDF